MRKSLLLIALAALVLLPIGAMADTVYVLSVGNGGLGGATPWGQASVSLTDSTHATLTFTAYGTNTFFGGGAFNFNTNGNVSYTSSLIGPAGCSNSTTPCIKSESTNSNTSGFGNFDYSVDMFDGPTSGTTPVSFYLTLSSGTWANDSVVLDTNGTYHVAAHVCPSFDGSGCAGGNTGYAADGPSTSTPEPASLALLSAGLLGLGGLIRRRK